jgi:hypothetical protein
MISVKDRWAFVDGKFPLIDRDSLNSVNKEEQEELSEEDKALLSLFLSLKKNSEDTDDGNDESDEDFVNNFSHATFEDITVGENEPMVFLIITFVFYKIIFL